MTTRRLVWLDTETTGLHPERRAWDIATITRVPGQPDLERQWFIDVADLDLPNADPVALDVGGFWTRHPQAFAVGTGRQPLPGVFRLEAVLRAVAGQVADRALILGSHPAFDMATLEPRMLEHGITPGWHYHPDDVPTLIKGWLSARSGMHDDLVDARSEALCRAVGVDPDRYARHTALGDCRLFRDAYDAVRRPATAGAR